ncbi:MAG TPA: amylo-alpha-1,6-glucosidase, partial [Candidatus Sumerlaeota bacterium]|nr:amylo-alpha-1,6-glucosidase [Candidatus Sumerlaeota bacterium]
FTDWGRDAMISFRGLFLESGRFEEARTLLLSFLSHYKDGLIPNTFPDGEAAPLYNTIDASLWFIHAVYEYYQATKDLDAIRTPFMEVIKDIIQHYIKGAPFGIGQDSDSLISGGEEGWQLTWMDAKVDGKVITPRIGKNVEINALWYHALRVAAIFSDLLDDEDAFAAYGLHAEKVKQSFEENFWFEDGGYLYDTLGSNGADPSIRPNQVFALSLPHPVINGSKAESVLATLERFLLTPYGLRSLAPGHPDYKKRYQGNLFSRDMAYHQGTVWPWLIGAYIDALLHVKGANRTSAEEGMEIIQPLLQHLETACLGSVSEIFDAEPPHAPRGCFAQAWSVAELLRAYMKLTRILQAT